MRYSQLATVAGLVTMAAAAPVNADSAALEARSPAPGQAPGIYVKQAQLIQKTMKKNKQNVKVYEATVKNTGKPPVTSSSKPKSKPEPKPAPEQKGKRDVEEEADEEGVALEARSPAFGQAPSIYVKQAKLVQKQIKKTKQNIKVYEATVKNTGKPPEVFSFKPKSKPESKPAPKEKGKRDVEDEEAEE
ncbi:hypothetical protein GGTG_07045 [Gaeumannomyces tritici R3-111a-1]|uniref:Uncharacterized protein n=1 Tax=Gaeumannomyces tritici (strain R3-111a-1) TaxID=644352 RepID=J3P0K0_GAET3|nr:hypothetical protein GGTG_07045 [Gaeumannomyces tritici R3-111a-1]EJT77133.1 hypothetical protein GGTG_07045 [Gaeumannomyces tritici R3-111a-1]